MNQTDRIGLFESLLDTFLIRAREKGYIILDVLGHPDELRTGSTTSATRTATSASSSATTRAPG